MLHVFLLPVGPRMSYCEKNLEQLLEVIHLTFICLKEKFTHFN